MTLEDFFTLKELKDGLTTPTRVEELIGVMREQKDCATSIVVDATIVANTLASTDNEECLNHFVYLDGLCFLNQWLQEALKFDEDLTDGEGLIKVLLSSLEKLPVDRKKLNASGICVTVEKLFGHEFVKQRAQTLLEKWRNGSFEGDDGCLNMEKLVDNSKPPADATEVEVNDAYRSSASIPCQTETMEGSCKLESGRSPNLESGNHNNFQGDVADNASKGSISYHSSGKSSFINPEKCETSACNSGQEELPAEEFSVTFVPSSSAPEPPSPKDHMNNNDQCITSAVKNDNQIAAEVNMSKSVPLVLGQGENVDMLPSRGQIVSSPAENPIEMHATSSNDFNVESEEGNHCESVPVENSPKHVAANHPESPKQSSLGEHIAEGIHDLWINGSLGSNELTENTNEVKEPCNERTLKPCREGDALKCSDPYKTSNFTADLDGKSDSEGDSVEFDALEVARQVAIQVEREVVDYREQSSSSPEVSSRDVDSTESHDMANREPNNSMGEEPNADASLNGQDVSDTASSPKTENCKFSENQRMESLVQTGAVHEPNAKAEKKHNFDLNADVCCEDLDCAVSPIPNVPANLSTPIAVSASKGPPGVPIAPLHFEGEQGWRGSAATSAFRPASPRRSMDGVNSNSGSKRKASLLEIDLNVVDSESDANLLPFSVPSGIPSRDSSIEVSSGRAERMHLDLNSVGEEEEANHLRLPHEMVNRCLSPTSSSTSRLPSIRNFDLNDNPCLFEAVGAQSPNVVKDISIMGSRMAIEGKTNTRPGYIETFAHGRPLIPYNQQLAPPSYCCIGVASGPVLPFQPALYGPGNIPQMMGSSGTNGMPLSSQPFLMNLANAPSGSYGVGPSRSGLDLNSGMMQMENGSREAGNMKHMFMPGNSYLLEEQRRTASQQPASGIPLKRKEPDSGYGFGFNQVNSWH